MERTKAILLYGDSNTWGYDPRDGSRYPYRLRWTSVCAALLGEDYCCIPAGMNGRTTDFDDPARGARNGLRGVDYELQTHKPLELMVIMLGTNDLKYTDAAGSAAGMERLLGRVLSVNERFCTSSPVFPGGPRLLLVSPIRMWAPVGARADCIAESARLSELYRQLAERHGLQFLDAARYAEPSKTDGVHLDVDGHQRLGAAIAGKIKTLL